jgi:hypothetical protein
MIGKGWEGLDGVERGQKGLGKVGKGWKWLEKV